MSTKKRFYNPELNIYANYTEEWLPEKVTVKDEELLVVNHYWRDKNGELWGDFDNPMENVYRSFAVYRKRKGYLSPAEIKKAQKKLGFTVREFAKTLGISSSALTEIENNHRIQTKYQDNLFRDALKHPADFKNNPSLNKNLSSKYNA